MKMSVMIVTQEEVDRFEKAVQAGAIAQAKLNPIKVKARHSTLVRAELDRLKLSLNNCGSMLQKTEDALAKASAALGVAEEQLASLREAGFRDDSPQVQKLTGSNFRSKATDLIVFQDGVISKLHAAIAEQTPRVKMLEENQAREAKRIAPIVRKLEAELEESLRLERVVEGKR
jgi:hypothetical protein